MRNPFPTLDSLVALGFEPRRTSAGLEGVGYRFLHLDLDAVHVMNLYAQYVVLLSGVLTTERSNAVIEDQIPIDLGSPLEAAAWVSYALRSHRSDLEPLPAWFIEGERHWDLVAPHVKSARPRKGSGFTRPPHGAISTVTMPGPFGVTCWNNSLGSSRKLR